MITGVDLLIRRTFPAHRVDLGAVDHPRRHLLLVGARRLTTAVDLLDLRVDGALDYTMTAVGAEQVTFMLQSGLPLATRSHKEFTGSWSRPAGVQLPDRLRARRRAYHTAPWDPGRIASGTAVEMCSTRCTTGNGPSASWPAA